MDATDIPFEKKYDIIGAFDVLEHIENDKLVMSEVHKPLRDNGLFYITVPQYEWMWSPLDDYACHKCRYSKKELREKLKKMDFMLPYTGSFVFLAFHS